MIIDSIFKVLIKKIINADPIAGFKFEIVLNREMQVKYYASILPPMGLDAKLSCQEAIFLIGLKCSMQKIGLKCSMQMIQCKFVRYVAVILEQTVNTYRHWLPVIGCQQAETKSK